MRLFILILALVLLTALNACTPPAMVLPFDADSSLAGRFTLPPTDALRNPGLLPFRKWLAVQRLNGADTLNLNTRQWKEQWRAEHALAVLAIEARQQEIKELYRAAEATARQANKEARIEARAERGPGWFARNWPWLAVLLAIAIFLVYRIIRKRLKPP